MTSNCDIFVQAFLKSGGAEKQASLKVLKSGGGALEPNKSLRLMRIGDRCLMLTTKQHFINDISAL